MSTDAASPPNRSSPWTDRLLNLATVAVLVLIAATLVRNWTTKPTNMPPGPRPLEAGTPLPRIESVAADNSTRAASISGAPRLVYVFATTCGVCEAQRDDMRVWLQTLPAGQVLTASRESFSRTREYWANATDRGRMAAALQLTASSADSIHAMYVPYVIVTDTRGVVQLSHVGPMAKLDTAKVRSLLSNH
jgi:hypothetical protein